MLIYQEKNVIVDIITPVYNSVRYIDDCVKSVMRCKSVGRHIILDSVSNDGTSEVIDNVEESRILHIINKDQGQADALSTGLDMTNTEFFGWINADDIYIENGIDVLANYAEMFPDCSIIYGDYVIINEHCECISVKPQPSFNRWDCIHSYMTVHNTAAIFNTRMSRECGGIAKQYRFAMDYDYIIRLSSMGPVVHVRRYVAAFRMHSSSKTSTLAEICLEETRNIRYEYSKLPRFIIPLSYYASKARVAYRMLIEGCIFERLRNRQINIKKRELRDIGSDSDPE